MHFSLSAYWPNFHPCLIQRKNLAELLPFPNIMTENKRTASKLNVFIFKVHNLKNSGKSVCIYIISIHLP